MFRSPTLPDQVTRPRALPHVARSGSSAASLVSASPSHSQLASRVCPEATSASTRPDVSVKWYGKTASSSPAARRTRPVSQSR